MQANRYEEALICYWKAFELKPGYCQWGITAALRQLGCAEDEITRQIRQVMALTRALHQTQAQIWRTIHEL